MKKALTITLALLLAACGVVQPVQQEQPTPIVQTVVVVATTQAAPPTAISLPTQAPTLVPPPTVQPTLVPTNTAEPTATTAAQQAAPASTDASGLVPVNVDNVLGKGVFTAITFNTDKLTLNCFPREMEISMKAALPEITRVEMYYRIVDAPSGLYPSEWMLVGNLGTDNNGTFYTTFKALDINQNYRGLDQAWIDFQFVGINKGGGRVDATQKIERLVTYYKNCP